MILDIYNKWVNDGEKTGGQGRADPDGKAGWESLLWVTWRSRQEPTWCFWEPRKWTWRLGQNEQGGAGWETWSKKQPQKILEFKMHGRLCVHKSRGGSSKGWGYGLRKAEPQKQSSGINLLSGPAQFRKADHSISSSGKAIFYFLFKAFEVYKTAF